jgi:hypothetical protein
VRLINSVLKFIVWGEKNVIPEQPMDASRDSDRMRDSGAAQSEKLKTLEVRARSRLQKKNQVKSRESSNESPLCKPAELEAQILGIEKLRGQYKEKCQFATDDISNGFSDQPQKIEGLLACVRSHLHLKTSYYRLGVLVAYSLLYVTVLFLQRDVADSFGIESR